MPVINVLLILLIFQWRIQRFFGNTVFSRVIQGRSLKGHNRELWTTIFSYKRIWMAWVWVIYYGKCNYYALFNSIRHSVREEFIQIKIKFIKIFSFSLIWDKNLGSHTGWPVAKPFWIRPCIFSWRISTFCTKKIAVLRKGKKPGKANSDYLTFPYNA